MSLRATLAELLILFENVIDVTERRAAPMFGQGRVLVTQGYRLLSPLEVSY